MLTLYNTLSRTKEAFHPRGDTVKIFTCGPSVYRRPHIGNYRTFLYEDILLKYLEYLGYNTKRIINFTDVEDKIIEEAKTTGIDAREIGQTIADQFLREAEILKIKLPPQIPRSSTSISEAVKLIQILLQKEIAYSHKGDIFFDPLRFRGFGKLFRLDMNRWPNRKQRFKRDTYIGQRWNRGDFILWHGYREGDTVYWDTEIGPGRPAWNIQDPAIITKHLGPTVDINCGGIDNLYRHHDYNIAVMESVSGQSYARYYLHGQHLVVDGKPMSKSRGNILYPEHVLENGYQAHHLRFFLISTHYRKKLNYTQQAFRQQAQKLDGFRQLLQELLDGGNAPKANKDLSTKIEEISAIFRAGMNDDLGVGKAFDGVYAQLQQLKAAGGLSIDLKRQLRSRIESIDSVFGVLF